MLASICHSENKLKRADSVNTLIELKLAVWAESVSEFGFNGSVFFRASRLSWMRESWRSGSALSWWSSTKLLRTG